MHLYRRRSTYHFRIRIPSDLRHLIPSVELIKSLKTKDPRVARIAVAPYAQKATEVFTLLRVGILDPTQAIEQLNSLLQRKTDKEVALSPSKHIITLSVAIKQFIGDRQHGWGIKTKLENEGSYKLILDILGDIDIQAINRGVSRDLKETLMKLPANLYKTNPDKSVKDVLNIVGVTPMSIPSVNKHMSRFSSLMKYCRDEFGLCENPAVGLTIRQKRRHDEERKAYDGEDIKRLIDAISGHQERPERFWIPLISLYSGLRLDEISQLHINDVRKVDGIWCFDINDDGDKKLKTLSSKRVVPIHSRLLELGILRHVEINRKAGHPRLWMNLQRRDADGYSNSVGKWYQRINRKFISSDPQKSFHSLRHTVADRLKQKGVQEAIIAEIMGHARDSITMSRYGKRYQPALLLNALQLLEYEINLPI